ncbi:MAG: hypothetical protein WAV31_00025 [Candidatus Moraniibacteriota bacterium]
MKKLSLTSALVFGITSAVAIPCLAYYVYGIYEAKDFFEFSIEASAAFIASVFMIFFSLKLLRQLNKKEASESEKFQHLKKPKTYKEGEKLLPQ